MLYCQVKANKRDVDLLHAHIKALENRLSTLGQALDDARESFANRANEMQAHQDAVEMELKSGLAEKVSDRGVYCSMPCAPVMIALPCLLYNATVVPPHPMVHDAGLRSIRENRHFNSTSSSERCCWP